MRPAVELFATGRDNSLSLFGTKSRFRGRNGGICVIIKKKILLEHQSLKTSVWERKEISGELS
jgi:hypothetical protein